MNALLVILQSLCFILLCSNCSSPDEQYSNHLHRNQKGEYIYRRQNESTTSIPPPEKIPPTAYPWNKKEVGHFSKISKEFFRCKGSSLHPYHSSIIKGEVVRHYDCNGANKHSLPLKDGKEFIYPILIELVNHIQEVTGKRVVITSGHRCPDHNTYVDPSLSNQYSKHMIGAEVSFYVQGLEDYPEDIVTILQTFYKENPRYSGNREFEEFKRYEKDTNVSTQPWYNKEIFIKIHKKNEARNFDNRHPYPYLAIQVRYDRDNNENVIYNSNKAFHNYHRW